MQKSTPKVSSSDSGPALAQKAQALFSAGRYKEAADSFKNLLKNSDDAGYRQQLAECYLRRAQSMAAKGMSKEASVLWENYAIWAQPPLASIDAYILWQLSAKNTQNAYARLSQLTAQQLAEDYPDLAVWLGFLLLSGHTDVAEHLPQSSALLTHFGYAREALDACRNRQTADCVQALQQLPFRSAFRDFRSLLKAHLACDSSPEQAQTLLSKIPDTSPYRPAADALLACTLHGSAFAAAMLGLDHNQRRIVANAKGLSAKQQELLDTLAKLKGQLTDKVRFNIALQYRALFGTEAARAFCQSLLSAYAGGRKDYLKYFEAKGAFEEHRIQALLCEKDEDGSGASFYWGRCIDLLKNQNPESDKKIALILRHMASDTSPGEANRLIIESLEYDPDDKSSYLKILAFYDQKKPDPAKYQHWLDISLKRFPSDVDLLAYAAKSASNKKAFKKAAGYAQALLKIDPVNTLAKRLLFASHLAHARRLIKTEKFHLVVKEIQAAGQLTVDKALRRQAELLRGFYVWLAEDKTLGLQLIVESLLNLNDNPVNTQFQAYMEASLLDLPFTHFSQALPPFKDSLLSEHQLTRLIALIKHYDEQTGDTKLLLKALDNIKTPINKSIQLQNFNEEVLLAWCALLESIGHYELLKHCAKLAHGKWQKPIWLYYLTLSECRGDAGKLAYMTVFKLQNALENARQENDHKTALLIGRLIERNLGYQSPAGFDFYDDGYDEEEMSETDIFDDLFGHVPDSVMDKISQKIQAIMMKTDPESFMAETIGKHSPRINAKRLTILFNHPDFMSALAVLKAAEELRIDIGVGFEDIVYRFENDTPQASLPFF